MTEFNHKGTEIQSSDGANIASSFQRYSLCLRVSVVDPFRAQAGFLRRGSRAQIRSYFPPAASGVGQEV